MFVKKNEFVQTHSIPVQTFLKLNAVISLAVLNREAFIFITGVKIFR